MELIGGEALIFTKFFRGRPIFFRRLGPMFVRGKPMESLQG